MTEAYHTITVRPARAADLRGFAAMKAQSWQETYQGIISAETLRQASSPERIDANTRAFIKLLDNDPSCFVVAVEGERVVGGACMLPARDEDLGNLPELVMLYVLASHHGRGLGRRLFEAIAGARPCYLWVAKDNAHAIGFYKHCGFTLDGHEAPIDPSQPATLKVRMIRAATA